MACNYNNMNIQGKNIYYELILIFFNLNFEFFMPEIMLYSFEFFIIRIRYFYKY